MVSMRALFMILCPSRDSKDLSEARLGAWGTRPAKSTWAAFAFAFPSLDPHSYMETQSHVYTDKVMEAAKD